jgi:hypothetical protein
LPLRNVDSDSMTCTIGHNSPAARPEFVDISLNATREVGQVIQQEEIVARMKAMMTRNTMSDLSKTFLLVLEYNGNY